MKKNSASDLLMLLLFAFCAGTALRTMGTDQTYAFALSVLGAMGTVSYAAIRIVNRSHERAVTRR